MFWVVMGVHWQLSLSAAMGQIAKHPSDSPPGQAHLGATKREMRRGSKGHEHGNPGAEDILLILDAYGIQNLLICRQWNHQAKAPEAQTQ